MEDKTYFVVVYDQENTPQTIRMETVELLLEWINDHKESNFAVFEGKCILDWS